MKRKIVFLLLNLLFCSAFVCAQQKSDLQQRAEKEAESGKIASARSLWIRAYEDYAAKGKIAQGVECGVKGAALYYKENLYKEAFELLRSIDQTISANKRNDAGSVAAMRYVVAKERMSMYMKMRKNDRVKDMIDIMERYANASDNDSVKNDWLYNKAIYYYAFGQTAKGNEVFKEMAAKLTAQKEYDKVDEVYQTLIANGRKSGNASMVAQAYSGYIAWKDSVNAQRAADETAVLKQQIAQGEASIAEKNDMLTSRQRMIVGLCILSAVLAIALVLCILVLLRFIVLTRKQKKTISRANENNALKGQFINNIASQLNPALQKLDNRVPEVKALQDFSLHIQTLTQIETTADEPLEMEETQLPTFCESVMDSIRTKVKAGVNLTVDAPKMSAMINKEYVSYILTHLLNNAAEYTPANGQIWLEYKKRGAHKHQFIVSNTGEHIPEEKHEDVFKPFLEIKDLTTGDGLGLPICKQMAIKMNGDLEIAPDFTKGTRFVLNLQA